MHWRGLRSLLWPNIFDSDATLNLNLAATGASFARECNWLAASSRGHHLNVTEAMARAVLKTAKAEHALRLSAADGITLAGDRKLLGHLGGRSR